MNVLVTGATGFIGSHLVPALLKAGHGVTVFARDDSDTSELPEDRITLVRGAFSDEQLLTKTLKGIHAVVHLVGTWNTWGKSARDVWGVNVFPLQQILRCAPKALKHVVFLSSAHVYDLNQPSPITEGGATKPWNQYAASKLEAERILKESGRPYTILRPGIVYGEGDAKGFVANLIHACQKKFVFVPGTGNNTLHLVHISDLADATVTAVHAKPNNHTLTIAGPDAITLNELIDHTVSLSATAARVIHIPRPVLLLAASLFQYLPSSREPLVTRDRIHIASASRAFDCSAARTVLSFTPRRTITQELPEIINAVLKQGAAIKRILPTPLATLQKAAERIPTPFFVFDERTLIQNYQKLFRSIAAHYPNTTVYYSAKTNYEPAVLTTLNQLGASLEIACGHELMAGTRAGFSGSQMCFDGPVKTEHDLAYAMREKVSIYNLDSYEAAEQLNALAASLRTTVRVGYRINLGMKGFLKGPAEAYITKFGIELADAVETYLKTKSLPHLRIAGIHTHIGSQITEPRLYARTIQELVRLAGELEREGITIEEINVGGGIPSPQLTKTTLLDLAASIAPPLRGVTRLIPRKPVPAIETYGTVIGKTFALESKQLKQLPRLCLEPGRSLVSNMGILVARVAHVKGRWAFLDASTYSVPESIFFAKRRFLVPERLALSPVREYALAGASLNTADIFSNRERFPVLSPGDLVLVLDAGAYSLSRAVQFTILHPPVYMLKGNKVLQLIREKGTYESALAQTHQGTTRITLE